MSWDPRLPKCPVSPADRGEYMKPKIVDEILAADKSEPEASFDNAADMLAYLNDAPMTPAQDATALANELAKEAATYQAGSRTRQLLHKAADALRAVPQTPDADCLVTVCTCRPGPCCNPQKPDAGLTLAEDCICNEEERRTCPACSTPSASAGPQAEAVAKLEADTIPQTDDARQFPLYELAPDFTLFDRDPQADERLKLYRDIFAEITAKAIPVCDPTSDDPERVRHYRIPVGPLHRAAGKLGFQLFDGERHLANAVAEIARLSAAHPQPQQADGLTQDQVNYMRERADDRRQKWKDHASQAETCQVIQGHHLCRDSCAKVGKCLQAPKPQQADGRASKTTHIATNGSLSELMGEESAEQYRKAGYRVIALADFLQADGRGAVIEAFEAGALAVHREWLAAHDRDEGPPRGDPDFGEAARDYAALSQSPATDGAGLSHTRPNRNTPGETA